ncbi:hypothetical protein ACLOJK_027172 [Asimina triloba]
MELLELVTSCLEADYTNNKPLAQLAFALSTAVVVPFPALTPDLHRSHPVSLLIDDGGNASSAMNHSPIGTYPHDPCIPTLSTSSACFMALPSPSPSSPDLFGYIGGAADNNPDVASVVGPSVVEIIIAAVLHHNDDPARITKAFLSAISKNNPLIPVVDADNLVGCLLDEFIAAGEGSTSVPRVLGYSLSSLLGLVAQSEASSLSSPHIQTNGDSSSVGVAVLALLQNLARGNGSVTGRSILDQFGGPHGGLGDGVAALK